MTALLLAESGYAPANPPEWIEKLSPEVVLLSVAAGDREGRPDAEVLEALDGYTLLRTDRDGWIELTMDGERMWIEGQQRLSSLPKLIIVRNPHKALRIGDKPSALAMQHTAGCDCYQGLTSVVIQHAGTNEQ